MDLVLSAVFSFSGTCNYLHGQMCSLFRQLAPKVSVLSYLDEVCAKGEQPPSLVPNKKLALAAIKGGHVHLLEYNKDQDLPKSLCRMAAKLGHLNILQWAFQNNYHRNHWLYLDIISSKHMDRKESLDMVKWVLHGCIPDGSLYGAAAEHDRLDIIEWALKPSLPRDNRACIWAAKKGNLPLLKWLKERGFPCDVEASVAAARNGHLEVLKWLRDQGYPWDERICRGAARGTSVVEREWLVSLREILCKA